MKILLDCSHIATGGAIQNALAVLHNAKHDRSHTWHVVMTSTLSRQVSRAADASFASVRRLDGWGPLRTRYTVHLAMPAWERAITPDITFAPGGPVYWRARAWQIVAFALPHLIYPEVDIYRNLPHHERLRLKLLLRAARNSFSRADALVVQTETVRERASRLLPFPAERICVVKNSYSPIFAEHARNARRHREDGRFIVLVPSAYYAHKNLESVVDVAAEIFRMGLRDVEFRLTLPEISRGWRIIRHRANSRGVGSMITSLGMIPHHRLAAEYRGADVVFLPTLLECSTAVYPEAFLAHVPLVTSDLDFARDLCGEAACFIDPLDPRAMASAIVDLARDERARQELVDAGVRVLTRNYVTPSEKWSALLTCLTKASV